MGYYKDGQEDNSGYLSISDEVRGKHMLNKVPMVITIFFLIIKIMETIVGETAAYYLNEELNLEWGY
ncbi:hypothetical protein ACFVSW_00220 [Neobacillus sp. NPDC058068]|uniref:hypothetical protein n=1 Tax=Neobacillus sp. NPDC058068 TaxID=3346325 RepID=UPI0036D815D1